MVLKYSFEYLSNNSTMINFLICIADESNIEYKVEWSDCTIDFYVSSSIEKISLFNEQLTTDLPMSVFLKTSTVEECEEFPQTNALDKPIQNLYLAFCPKCIKEIDNQNSLNFANPFYSCSSCNSSKEQLILNKKEGNTTERISNYLSFFDEIAQKIEQGLKVKIETRSGVFVFEKMNLIEDNSRVLCTNLMNLSSVFVAKKSEVVALASIEKPQIKLYVNEVYKQKNSVNITSANVRYVNDLLLYLLGKALEKYGIDFLSYSTNGTFDIEITTGFTQSRVLNVPQLKLLDNDKVLVIDNALYDDKLNVMYEKFEQKNKGHFMVLLQENNLFDSSILNFYTSSLDDDNVCLYNNNIGSFLDILNYELPSSMEELFEQIQRDDTGKRLFENYKNKFPDNINSAQTFDMSTLNKSSIVSLWKLVRVILGFETTVLNHATACMLEKGPRIDYKLFEQDKIYNKQFDFIKLIRSGMSFKLAAVDDNAIALGYIESYAHFIAHIVDEVNQEITLDGISLCGDIFANNLISNFIHKSITKNYKIYYNKDFVIQVS